MINFLTQITSHLKRILIHILIFHVVFFYFNTIQVLASDNDNRIRTIVIDAGHGGQDPGALGKTSKEKDVVLAVALKVGQAIMQENADINVIYTRNNDTFIPLHERADIANKNHADLFISIHANANKNKAIYGAETYSMGLHTSEKNLDVAKKENAVITFEKDYTSHYEGYDPNSAESFIIFSLMQNTFMEQSLEFASMVQQQFTKNNNRVDRGVRQAGFLVLWKTTMPSVLIEVGFVSNPEEEKYLNTKDGQEKIAKSIAKAFFNYKNIIEGHSNNNSVVVKNIDTIEKNNIISIDPDTFALADTLVTYKIQITSASKPLATNIEYFKPCKKISDKPKIEEFKVENIYKYTIGQKNTYQEIVEYNKEVRLFYPQSFIVAVKNGQIIPLSDALKQPNN
jgi:N-acetylmuramoyl-L-alanine amidase